MSCDLDQRSLVLMDQHFNTAACVWEIDERHRSGAAKRDPDFTSGGKEYSSRLSAED